MSNLEILNKLTEGINETQDVTINFEGEDYPFRMRPLTDGELSKLKKIENSSFSLKFKIDGDGKRRGKPERQDNEALVDGGDFSENRDIVKYTAIAWSLSVDDEIVPIEAVKGLTPGLPDLLFTEVIKMSSLDKTELIAIKQFR